MIIYHWVDICIWLPQFTDKCNTEDFHRVLSGGVVTAATQLQHKFHYSCQISVIAENLFANKRLWKNEIEMAKEKVKSWYFN